MQTDRLEEIFALQERLDRKVVEGRDLNYDLSTWLQKETIAIMVELAEMLNEANYKWWKNPEEIRLENVKEELVDVFHFFVSMCIKTGMNAEELHQRYLAKNLENHKRQDGTSGKSGYAPQKEV